MSNWIMDATSTVTWTHLHSHYIFATKLLYKLSNQRKLFVALYSSSLYHLHKKQSTGSHSFSHERTRALCCDYDHNDELRTQNGRAFFKLNYWSLLHHEFQWPTTELR